MKQIKNIHHVASQDECYSFDRVTFGEVTELELTQILSEVEPSQAVTLIDGRSRYSLGLKNGVPHKFWETDMGPYASKVFKPYVCPIENGPVTISIMLKDWQGNRFSLPRSVKLEFEPEPREF